MRKKVVNGYDTKSLRPEDDPTSIGNLVIEHGFLSSEEFKVICSRFQELTVGQLLGEYLVAADVLTKEQLDYLLIKQRQLRNEGRVTHKDLMDTFQVAKRSEARREAALSQLCAAVDRTKEPA